MNEKPALQLRLPHVFATIAALLAGVPILTPAPLPGQSSESKIVAFLVQDGLRYSEQRRYSDAINALEEAWERDPSNPIVAEHLARAYLYEHIPPRPETLTKAQELMRFSLEHGGQASVFAQHLHNELGKVVSLEDHCSGVLILRRGLIQYRASFTKHSFSLSSDQLESIVSPKRERPGSAGNLTLRAKDGKRYRIRTGTLRRPEAQIVLQLTREFLLGG